MAEYISGASDLEMTTVDSALPAPQGNLYLLSHLFIAMFLSILCQPLC